MRYKYPAHDLGHARDCARAGFALQQRQGSRAAKIVVHRVLVVQVDGVGAARQHAGVDAGRAVRMNPLGRIEQVVIWLCRLSLDADHYLVLVLAAAAGRHHGAELEHRVEHCFRRLEHQQLVVARVHRDDRTGHLGPDDVAHGLAGDQGRPGAHRGVGFRAHRMVAAQRDVTAGGRCRHHDVGRGAGRAAVGQVDVGAQPHGAGRARLERDGRAARGKQGDGRARHLGPADVGQRAAARQRGGAGALAGLDAGVGVDPHAAAGEHRPRRRRRVAGAAAAGSEQRGEQKNAREAQCRVCEIQDSVQGKWRMRHPGSSHDALPTVQQMWLPNEPDGAGSEKSFGNSCRRRGHFARVSNKKRSKSAKKKQPRGCFLLMFALFY